MCRTTAHTTLESSGGGSSGGVSVVAPKTPPSVVTAVARVAFIKIIPPFRYAVNVSGVFLTDVV
jgi:hypothetical protein